MPLEPVKLYFQAINLYPVTAGNILSYIQINFHPYSSSLRLQKDKLLQQHFKKIS